MICAIKFTFHLRMRGSINNINHKPEKKRDVEC